MHTRDYRLLEFLVCIVEEGSLTAAARRLHVSTPVVSKALADLEEQLNATLVVRGSVPVTVTAAGESVYTFASAMAAEARKAMSVLADDARIDGQLSVTAPNEIAQAWLPNVLIGFRQKHPNVTVTINADDHNADLAKTGVDLAIRAHWRLDQPARAASFLSLPLDLVCAPNWLISRTRDVQKRIQRIPFVGFTFRRDNAAINAVSRKTGKRKTFRFTSEFLVNSASVGKQMALQGAGSVLLLTEGVKHELIAESLVRLAPEYEFGAVDLSFLMRDQWPSAAAKAFVNYLSHR